MDILLTIKGMARSTYYYNIHEKADKYEFVRKRIHEIYEKHKGRYGYRRICLTLKQEGYNVNHKTVAILMQQEGLQAKQRKIRYRSYKGEVGKTAPNIIDRDFKADKPYQKLTTDVSQIDINGKKLYLSPVLDMYEGEILSYVISDSPNLQMVMTMLRKTIHKLPRTDGVILHSDQGWHYQHKMYQKLLKDNGIIQSMSRKGNCLDNAMMENFFGLMKKELLYVNRFESVEDFKRQLKQYIQYYNNERIKLRLKMSPVQYRTHYQFYNKAS